MSSRITVLKQTLYKTCAIQVGLSINLEYESLKDLKVPKGFNVQSFKLENLASYLLSYQQTVSQFTRYRRSLVTDSAQRQKGVQWFPFKCHTVDSSVFTLNSPVFLHFTVIFPSFWHKLGIFINLATFRIVIDAYFSTFPQFKDSFKLYGKVFVD